MEYKDYAAFVKDVSTQKVQGEMLRINWAIQEMAAEAGEVVGVSVKSLRKGIPIDKDRLWDELSDTFWGIAAIMNEAFPDKSLEDLMKYNQDKLVGRMLLEATKTT